MPLFLLSAGGSAEGAARGRLHCSRSGIRIRAIRARTGRGGSAISRLAPRAMPGAWLRSRSSARPEGPALPLADGMPPHRPRGTSHPACLTPRGEQAANGLLPASRRLPARLPSGPRQPPPGPAIQNGGCSLFAATAASIRPAGHRNRGCRLPPPPSGVKILTGA